MFTQEVDYGLIGKWQMEVLGTPEMFTQEVDYGLIVR